MYAAPVMAPALAASLLIAISMPSRRIPLPSKRSAAVAPQRVPRPQVVPAERPFDAWAVERPGHRAVELTPSAERDHARRRSEIGEDAGEQLIGLLQVAHHDVEIETPASLPIRTAV